MSERLKFYEFFCGGGMARAGLGPNWDCLFANDIDLKKAASYRLNWGDDALKTEDISKVAIGELPGQPDLAWASFPCQDLSLAGAGAGLAGERSGTFWPFWSLIKKMRKEERAPKMVVLENVCGALTSHKGADFLAICKALKKEGYTFGAMVIDAARFLPQSRPRLFIVAVQKDLADLSSLTLKKPDSAWHSNALINAYNNLEPALKRAWVWWNLPLPVMQRADLIELMEEKPTGVKWHTAAETKKLIGLMTPLHLAKLQKVKDAGGVAVGTIYKRTRQDATGKSQRAEVRFDNLAGCLRTPSGGSSRQTVILVENGKVRSRLLSSRETARLMGLSDEYQLPVKYNDAYHLTGDGIAVPVVAHIGAHILEPLLFSLKKSQKAA